MKMYMGYSGPLSVSMTTTALVSEFPRSIDTPTPSRRKVPFARAVPRIPLNGPRSIKLDNFTCFSCFLYEGSLVFKEYHIFGNETLIWAGFMVFRCLKVLASHPESVFYGENL